MNAGTNLVISCLEGEHGSNGGGEAMEAGEEEAGFLVTIKCILINFF